MLNVEAEIRDEKNSSIEETVGANRFEAKNWVDEIGERSTVMIDISKTKNETKIRKPIEKAKTFRIHTKKRIKTAWIEIESKSFRPKEKKAKKKTLNCLVYLHELMLPSKNCGASCNL